MATSTLTTSAVLMCPHGASVQISSSNSRVKADGAAAALSSDTFTISGCPFTLPPGSPSPCVKVQWLVSDVRSKVNSTPTLSMASVGLCLSAAQVPQGPVVISSAQARAKTQ